MSEFINEDHRLVLSQSMSLPTLTSTHTIHESYNVD